MKKNDNFVPDTPAMQRVGEIVDRNLSAQPGGPSRDRSPSDGARMLAAAIVMVSPKTTMSVADDTETAYALHVVECLEQQIQLWPADERNPEPDDWIVAAAVLWSRSEPNIHYRTVVERAAQVHQLLLSRFAARLAEVR